MENLPNRRVDFDYLLVELGGGRWVQLRLLGVDLLQDQVGEVLLFAIVGGEKHIQGFLMRKIGRLESTSSSSSMW